MLAGAVGGGQSGERVGALVVDLQRAIESLIVACRDQQAEGELAALRVAEASISEFLSLAKTAKFDVTPKEDINGYTGTTGVLYNKFLFRAG